MFFNWNFASSPLSFIFISFLYYNILTLSNWNIPCTLLKGKTNSSWNFKSASAKSNPNPTTSPKENNLPSPTLHIPKITPNRKIYTNTTNPTHATKASEKNNPNTKEHTNMQIESMSSRSMTGNRGGITKITSRSWDRLWYIKEKRTTWVWAERKTWSTNIGRCSEQSIQP